MYSWAIKLLTLDEMSSIRVILSAMMARVYREILNYLEGI